MSCLRYSGWNYQGRQDLFGFVCVYLKELIVPITKGTQAIPSNHCNK